jgi:hypothetical protein
MSHASQPTSDGTCFRPAGEPTGVPTLLLAGSSPCSHPPALALPLARSTLIPMGVRIVVILTRTTLFSYLHMFRTLRAEALAQLEQHVTERGQREQAVLALGAAPLSLWNFPIYRPRRLHEPMCEQEAGPRHR